MVNVLLKKAVRDIAIYFPGKLLPALIGLITIPIFSRLFKPAEYGILAIIGVFTTAGSIAVSNWLSSSVVRFLPHYRHKNQLGRFYSTTICSYGLSLAALIVFGVPVCLIIKPTVSANVYRLLPLAGLITAAGGLFTILQTIMRADQKAKQFVVVELSMACGSLIAGLSLVLIFRLGVDGIFWGSLLVMVIVNTGMIYSLFKANRMIRLDGFSGASLREFAAYGLPGGVATIGTWLLSMSDRYLIEYIRGTTEVGLYSMGYGIADKSINLVIASLALAVGPILINTWESENREATAGLLGQITRIVIILTIPMAIGLSILSDAVFRVFTTAAYMPGASVLPWVALGAILYGLGHLACVGLSIAKKTMIMARNYITAGFANVILNVLFIPDHGFIAAAINTTAAYGILLAMNIISGRKYLPWLFPWRTLRNVTVAAGIMAALLWTGTLFIAPRLVSLLLSVVIGAVIYGGSLLILGELTQSERARVVSLAQQVWITCSGRLRLWYTGEAK